MRRRLVPAALTLAAAVVMSGPLAGSAEADEPKDLVEYRQAVMSGIASHTGAIARMVRGDVSYDHILPHAEALAATTPTVADVWPENSGPNAYDDTGALARVWDEPDRFQGMVDDMIAASDTFLAAAETGDRAEIVSAFQQLGASCGACHDDYRAQ